ncbi:hypothetical protein GCM10011321_00640 [Youhaiella tibetensis]|uniref:DUF883 family protein n=1 Tax=Paradevosia tibetensis TaxID=1447062 RepID=A0A5B9DRG1_9HYPH|nr:DUF883 family protein [Youhaiella tibetensis]QEE21706.1 DUF883 family protein [Youhaiella tibetensis]GGF12433.1 hypothetical protein GCM10011321_00640 [Youhaiella tibetensis]
MASTGDLAPNRTTQRKASTSNGAANRAALAKREEHLEEMVNQLQEDIKAIAATLARMGNDKVSTAKETAKHEASKVVAQGQQMVDDLSGQAGELERQLKDTIRERPLTAVASAVGIGFILALLARK